MAITQTETTSKTCIDTFTNGQHISMRLDASEQLCVNGKRKKHRHRQAARKLVYWAMENEFHLQTTWIAGKKNNVADSLSRDFHFTNAALTKFLFHSAANQMPTSFKIVQLPKEIKYWLTLQLQKLPEPMESHNKPTPSTLCYGAVGKITCDQWASKMTHSSKPFVHNFVLKSQAPSLKPCNLEDYKRKGTVSFEELQLSH